MTEYKLVIDSESITMNPQINGVEIVGSNSEGQWAVNDGYQTQLYATVESAVAGVKAAIAYYSEEEYEITEVWLITRPLCEVMTAGEAQKEFDLSESAVRQAIRRNQIGARKSSEDWLIMRKDAEMKWGHRKGDKQS
jgi:hypothetical protein